MHSCGSRGWTSRSAPCPTEAAARSLRRAISHPLRMCILYTHICLSLCLRSDVNANAVLQTFVGRKYFPHDLPGTSCCWQWLVPWSTLFPFVTYATGCQPCQKTAAMASWAARPFPARLVHIFLPLPLGAGHSVMQTLDSPIFAFAFERKDHGELWRQTVFSRSEC